MKEVYFLSYLGRIQIKRRLRVLLLVNICNNYLVSSNSNGHNGILDSQYKDKVSILLENQKVAWAIILKVHVQGNKDASHAGTSTESLSITM